VDCGHVEEFMDGGIEERQQAVAKRLGFEISDHALTLYGHCRKANCPNQKRGK
jgi:Fur family ferric uptake transcriptional regulator